jgi:hypothetical protein
MPVDESARATDHLMPGRQAVFVQVQYGVDVGLTRRRVAPAVQWRELAPLTGQWSADGKVTPLTDEPAADDGDDVLTLSELVSSRMRERGWSLGDLVNRSRHGLSKSRWQQYATGQRIHNLPEAENLQVIADVLEVDVTTVLLAAGRSAGLSVRRRGPALAHLLPAGTDMLPTEMRDAILAVIRSAVVALAERGAGSDEAPMPGGIFEWDQGPDSSIRRNATGRAGDTTG